MYLRKKSQEEIAGFVLIVVLVAIVFLIFLGISLRSSDTNITKESKDVRRFIESSWKYTTDCALDYEPHYKDIQDLTDSCRIQPEKICTSGKNVCTVLNSTFVDLLDASWNVGGGSAIRGYHLDVFYSINGTNTKPEHILTFSKGNCSTSFYVGAAPFFSAYSSGSNFGAITYEMKLCY